jgi:hypothetical protein
MWPGVSRRAQSALGGHQLFVVHARNLRSSCGVAVCSVQLQVGGLDQVTVVIGVLPHSRLEGFGGPAGRRGTHLLEPGPERRPLTAVVTSFAILSTIDLGVLVGTNNPIRCERVKLCSPASSSVGTCGGTRERVSLVEPSSHRKAGQSRWERRWYPSTVSVGF